ncbi:FG-GAP repeat domain-containing protein [Streptomyces sp. enrichment culture]|uniref:FG-GAP repeat domain-containing protein n=1 Tax=Streptomyces sp. enrichment culture TaxID=1795815 RepID=UPI003F5603A0
MGRSALPRRRAAATAVVAVSLVLASAALPAAPAVAATTLPPWTDAVDLASERTIVQDVAVRGDGTSVALWIRSENGDPGILWAATRAAGGDTWSAPVALSTSPVREAELTARANGSVVALWAEFPSPTQGVGTGPSRLSRAILGAGQTEWTIPTDLVIPEQQRVVRGLDLTEGRDGTLAAVWTALPMNAGAATSSEVYASVIAPDGSHSAPQQVSNASTWAGPTSGMRVGSPEVASDASGELVVSYRMQPFGYGTVHIMTAVRPAGGDAWQTPQLVTTDVAPLGSPTLSAGPQGAVLVWPDKNKTLQVMRRWSFAGEWGQPETAVTGVEQLAQFPDPMVGADGDVTLVWSDYRAANVQTTTLDTDTGRWSAPQLLSNGEVSGNADSSPVYDVEMAPDGSIHALWHQRGDYGRSLRQATRVGDTWTAPRWVKGASHEYLTGQISARSASEATAVWSWHQSTTYWAAGLRASHTAWPQLKVTGSSVPESIDFKTYGAWEPSWWTNVPVATWTLTLTDRAGRTVRTLTGTPEISPTAIRASWNGRTASGAWAANGKVNWTLKATQPEAPGTTTLASGSVMVAGAAPVLRDYGGAQGVPDGGGDLLMLTSTGRLQMRHTNLTATRELGTGWPTTVRVVPFGDLSGDRCNDVLVRLSTGALRLYKPTCGGTLKTSTPYTALGSGWNQYNVLTFPGDLTKDGRPDLITRNASTGAVYLHKGTSTGKLAAPVKLYSNWKTYKKIVGAGDLNGDGVGDLIAQDTANNLYRYLGRGNGTFGARVKLAANWGSSYNLVLGAGDVTGDGRADLVARDTAGVLWRQAGTGTGTFGARVKAGTGWGSYKGVF